MIPLFRQHLRRAVSLSALLFLTSTAVAANAQFGRSRGNPFATPLARVHTARQRSYHVRHMKLDFQIDATNHSAHGVVTHYLTPLQAGLAQVNLDAGANLKILSCKVNGVDTPFTHEGEVLAITPASALPMSEAAIEVAYDMPPAGGRGGGANGAGGFTWINPSPNDPARVAGFWTQGETETNHKWVPLYDSPNDKCTSETHTTVPENWTVIGNGTEMPSTENATSHTRTYNWVMKQPHSTYLLSLAGGEMDVQKSQWSGVQLYYAVPKGMGGMIPYTFGHTPDMLAFFSRKFGVKYPWPKYAQVCAYDFPGGMENVSATTLGSPDFVMIDARSSQAGPDSLISHELGHQWFGDYVTCSDWGDVWLNEGFATFCEMIYTEHQRGKDYYEADRMGAMNQYMFEQRRYRRPLATNMYSTGDVMFGQGQTYARGGLTLHMLRTQLGETVFFNSLAHYLKQHAYQPVTTQDLIKSMSETAGRDLTPWFDQWVFKPGHPVVDSSWSYDEAGKYTVLHLKQTQDLSSGTPIYTIPMHVAVITPATAGAEQVVETTVQFDKADQEFHIPGLVKPDSVIIDPHHDLLMEQQGAGPADSELAAQLKYAPSYQDRLRAARRLAANEKGKEEATVKMLTDALQNEKSDLAASGIIGLLADTKMESLRGLFRTELASRSEVRRGAALSALGALPKTPEDVALLRKVALSDSEPYTMVENAMRGLARMDLAANIDVFNHQVGVPSARERLANTVVTLVSAAKVDAGVPVLLEAASPQRKAFLRRNAIRAIGTLAPDSPAVHAALVAASKSEGETFVQMAAIDVLKERKDVGALDTLRDLAANAKDGTVRSMAQDAVTDLSGK